MYGGGTSRRLCLMVVCATTESNRATTVVCCGGAVRVVMFDILYGSVYLKLNVGKWVASVTTEPGKLS